MSKDEKNVPPPSKCDPTIVGNREGNKRDLAKDKAAAAARRGTR